MRDELAHLRIDQVAPAAAAEDAVVAGALHGEVLLLLCGDAGAQACAARGLAEAGDVVQFAFDASSARCA
jgi:hypothetical protein